MFIHSLSQGDGYVVEVLGKTAPNRRILTSEECEFVGTVVYRKHLFEHGVAEGNDLLRRGSALTQNLHLLNAFSVERKGCYLGQEHVNRIMSGLLKIRKRLTPLSVGEIDEDLVDCDLVSGLSYVGKVIAQQGHYCLAMVQCDDSGKIVNKNLQVMTKSSKILRANVKEPDWWLTVG
ncbi:hypothetical protein ACOME3_004845 [Neoechinorhynchus agilis]